MSFFDVSATSLGSEAVRSGFARTHFSFGKAAFYFVRHGETLETRNGIVQGQSDSRLTEVGRASARAVGLRLRDYELGSIYASPLRRAWATASIISEVTGTSVQAVTGLKERHWGIYEGKPKAERPDSLNPGTAEAWEAFCSRVMTALRSIEGPNPVLVVAHSGVFRALAQQCGLEKGSPFSIASAQLVCFEPPRRGEDRWRLSEVDP